MTNRVSGQRLPGPGYDPRATCPKCGKAVMLPFIRAHMVGHRHEDEPYDDRADNNDREQ